MSHEDGQKIQSDAREIISPVPFVSWLVQSGPVRKGQLLGIGSESDTNKIEESKITETTKPKIIRARKIKRNLPPVSSIKSETSPLANKIPAEDEEDGKSSFLSKYIDTGESSSSILKREDQQSSTERQLPMSSSQFEIRSPSDGIIYLFPTPRNKQVDSSENRMLYAMGMVEPCNHPAIIDGLCVLCGQSASIFHDPSSDDGDNTNKRNALTLTGGVTVSISSEYGQAFSNETAQSLRASKKLNLVLDLDHTLLHATPDSRAKKWLSKSDELRTVHLPMMEGNPFQQNGGYAFQPHYIKLRPHLAEFIISSMNKYEVSIYTAGTRLYAEKIADVISRHVAHYLKFSNNLKDDIGYLDEMELQMLRRDVLHLKDRVSWYKSKKERQEYIDRMKEEESKQADMNNVEDKNDDKTSNTDESIRKRKRVTFDMNLDKDSEEDEDHDLPLILAEKEKQLKLAEEREEEVQVIRKKLFGSRIISRTDVGDLGLNVKSLKRAFPCGGMMAVIVDDREDVWANAENNLTGRKGEPPDNLFFIKPYHWTPFLEYADVNNAAGEDLTQQRNKKDDENIDSLDESGEQHLLWTADVLSRIHNVYYDPKINEEDRNELTVPSILKRMRSEIFSSENQPVKILLSGLVPIDKQDPNSNYTAQPRPHVIRYAEEMGATVVPDVTPDLTYVVSARDGTDKILRARKIPGCAILSVAFLMDCYWRCMKLDIDQYIIGARPRPKNESAVAHRSILLSGSDSSEDEDEDFVNAFEKEMKSK
jgi:RNA polymerase II subunit A-like phosphatase